ncbi:VIR protein [Plasmodium vivax]|uniref:VIR protein n=1 Tax=Plasmodium vivax TaxID=5855 RepID=A0A1G4E8Y6_PLAVI|nr:VIR protein [Plasmodium vivax]
MEEGYPFLGDISFKYIKYDMAVDYNVNKNFFDQVCYMFLKNMDKDMMRHKNFCMKLLRNLGHYTSTPFYFNPTLDDCNVLNYWIYNSVKKDNVPDEIIDKCFDDYTTNMREMHMEPKCYYHSYNNMYKEPLKAIILHIFYSNMDLVKNIIDKEDDSTDSSLQRYICECVNLYHEMNMNNCHQSSDEDQKGRNICSLLSLLKAPYELFLFNNENKNYKIPSLDDNQNKYLTECQKYLEEKSLDTTSDHHDQPIALSRTPNRDSNLDASISLPAGENQSSPMSSTVPTALGTVAGASSILALLYKFSPGRNWLRSGMRGGTGRVSSNLYADQPNEVFYDGFEGEVMSSYNPTYNVGYGSV